MRTCFVLLTLAAALAAQVKTELCWRVTDAKGTRESCMTIPAALRSALAQRAAEPSGPTSDGPHPQYRGPAHLISATLVTGLFVELLAKYAPSAAVKLEAQANTALEQAKQLRVGALPAVPGSEP